VLKLAADLLCNIPTNCFGQIRPTEAPRRFTLFHDYEAVHVINAIAWIIHDRLI
jgi:hypothetical protein